MFRRLASWIGWVAITWVIISTVAALLTGNCLGTILGSDACGAGDGLILLGALAVWVALAVAAALILRRLARRAS